MRFSKLKKHTAMLALTAMITLSLAGTAMAMPTGGTVIEGHARVGDTGDTMNSVMPNGTIDSIANGGYLGAREFTIIDWNDFSIAAGETLNVETGKGILVNTVNSGNISQLMGTLNQIGNHRMYLINPSGIVVGGGAVINADNLLLSTLVTDGKWDKTGDVDGSKNLTWSKSENNAPAKIVFDSGAAITGQIRAYASGIEVAEGVVFSAPDTANLAFVAADSITNDDSLVRTINDSTKTGTTVNFGGRVDGSQNVTIVGTDVTFSGNISQKDSIETGSIRVIGADKVNLDNKQENGTSEFKSAIDDVPGQYSTVTLTEGSRLHGINSKINVLGGKIDINGDVKGDRVRIYAERTADTYGPENTINFGEKADIKSKYDPTVLRANAITSLGEFEGTVDSNVKIVTPTPEPTPEPAPAPIPTPDTTIDIAVDEVSFTEGEKIADEVIKASSSGASLQYNLSQLTQAINKQNIDQHKKDSMIAGIISQIGAQGDEGKVDNVYGAIRTVLDSFETTGSDTESSENAIKSDANIKSVDAVAEAPLAAGEVELTDVTFS